ncbi:hypothetical protein CFC21_096123 [Triticum aestivum]|uniref:DUF569 domain-containing protein n=2 Tax=Triticum aestivum TaxID=4565 RepID=A0A9R1MY73_WHEAT|nr:hypothetical protein CFC21_096123 [Triticum aestivum]
MDGFCRPISPQIQVVPKGDGFSGSLKYNLGARSRQLGTYLSADEDGHGVSLHPRRASMNTAWAVHLHQGQNVQCLLLLSTAYSGYLAATDAPAPFGHRGLRVEQRNYDHPEVIAILWFAIPSESGDEVLLRHINRGCLRANGRYLRWNNGVSVQAINNIANVTTMMHWVVEHTPAREGMPPLPAPTVLQLHFPAAMLLNVATRLIHYVWLNDDVDGPLIEHGEFFFVGRSVFRLRNELAMQLGAIMDVSDLVMCLRTAHAELRYPDVHAE